MPQIILGLCSLLLGLVYAQYCNPSMRSYLPAALKAKVVPHLETLDVHIGRIEKSKQVAIVRTRLSEAAEKLGPLAASAEARAKKALVEGKRLCGLGLQSAKRKLSEWSVNAARALNEFRESEKVQNAVAAAKRHGEKVVASCKTAARNAFAAASVHTQDLRRKASSFAGECLNKVSVWADDLLRKSSPEDDD